MAPSPVNPRLILGLKIRSRRQRRGQTLKEVATRAGLSVSYLSEIEKGKKYPKPERLVDLARALETPFDELVSLEVSDGLTPLAAAFDSKLLRGFPLHLFGFEPHDVLALVSDHPQRGAALFAALAEVGRSYDVNVEHFLLAALRAYQQLRGNYFEELEEAADELRRQRGWATDRPLDAEVLADELRREWSYSVDAGRLAADADLTGFRSIHAPGPPPTLWINSRLMASQRAFVLAREIGFRRLGLEKRAATSPWLEVESFDQVLNNFQASYFAGALIMPRRPMRDELSHLFSSSRLPRDMIVSFLPRYGVTPETFLHRVTQLVPRYFDLDSFFFLRFNSSDRGRSFRLTKWLNTSAVAIPRGVGLSEHFCRRWPALDIVCRSAGRLTDAAHQKVAVTRTFWADAGIEFLEFSMARPLALRPSTLSGVTVGFLVDADLCRAIRFWNDSDLPRREVNVTCERCALDGCRERVAPGHLFQRDLEQRRRKEALERLWPRKADTAAE